jgi:hypothetical protein
MLPAAFARAYKIVVLGATVLGSLSVAGQAAEVTPGSAVYRACAGEAPHACLSYLSGVIDMHEDVVAPQIAPMFCIPDTISFAALADGIRAWYAAHPEAMEAPAVYGVTQTLAEMFPCDGAR